VTETEHETGAPVVTWVAQRSLGDLFVLHLDGEPAATTALVDRSAPRKEQMEALARLDWVPPQQMTQVYEATMQDRMPKPSSLVLPGGRRMGPLFSNVASISDGDEDASSHPVRRYLYPDVNRGGTLALEPEEEVITSWQAFKPVILTRSKDGTTKTASSTKVPNELRKVLGVLTTKRLVCFGHLDVPVAVREDYSLKLALVSPGLEELRATFRQVKRWHNRPNMYWGVHIRHEWASMVGHGSVPDHKGPLIKRHERTDFVAGAFVYPFGAVGILHIRPKEGQPTAASLAARYLDAVKADQPQITIAGPEKSTRAVAALGFSSRKETEETQAWSISGTVPQSLPNQL
jgi:hypothetical protein